MGVLDKFLDIMKLSDEDDYDSDDFFDDEEDDYDEKPRKKLFKKEKEKDYDDDYEEEIERKPIRSTRSGINNNVATSNKVTPMRQPAKKSNGMEVCVIKPTSVDDAREITETLLSNRTVILNLEGLDLEVAQRIIDFTSGATFAINGNLQKISNYIFLVTPTNVEITGDLQDLLSNSFDVPSIRNRF
ncbi:MAG: cell division protein SepF [Lachnospiraceae bacterium]|nr:cell division protein SepF [Lachnospiraceae bacterium]